MGSTPQNHIVLISGGKDSTAMALRLNEVEPRKYIYVCSPTGDELPEMEKHWLGLEDVLGQPIIRLRDPEYSTLESLIDHFQMLPNFRSRWCTRILKLELAEQFYNLIKPAILYIGLRADEEREGNKLFDDHLEQRFPMREWGWTIETVWSYLRDKNVSIPRRTDCGMCFYQRIDEWYSLWEQHPEIYKKYEDLEISIGHTLMAPGKHDIWPHWLFELRCEFEKGRMPRAVKRKKKIKNLSLFKSDPYDYGNNKRCRVCSL